AEDGIRDRNVTGFRRVLFRSWLATLERIGKIDAAVIVPGHGEPCGRSYLARQAEIIQAWIGAVEDFVRRGLSEEEALKEPTPPEIGRASCREGGVTEVGGGWR